MISFGKPKGSLSRHRRHLFPRCLRRVPVVIVTFATLLAGCTSTPEKPDEPFTRSSLLIDAIDTAIQDGDYTTVLNRVQYGHETGLLSEQERFDYLEQYVRYAVREYNDAIDEELYRRAIALGDNVRLLNTHFADVKLQRVSAGLEDRDSLLLRWAEKARNEGDEVLALYLVLRRSSLGGLTAEQLADYVVLARRFNHDEGLLRLVAMAERTGTELPTSDLPTASPQDDPAQMLPGTVTIWVNRGIRIEQGVGFPDRVIGSGFFVDPRGYLITNHHVIASEVDPTYEGYSRLYVKLPGRPDERVPARVVGYDRIFDLALLKVEIDPTYVFSLSDIKDLSPGQSVFALGSPGGLDSTITSGIVSASGRRFLQMGEAMQVDVPINPGNSGGPLVLPTGQVAGVVFAGLEQFEGVNFAIPAYWIHHFFPQLFEEGEVRHAWLGISVREVEDGLKVTYVAPESPADRGGIVAGDVLLGIQDTFDLDLALAQDILLGADPGALLYTTWRVAAENEEESETRERFIAIAERPFSPVEEALQREPIEELFPVLFGMEVDDVSGAPWGPDFVIAEVYPGSVADESSLSVDDPFALRNWRVDTDIRAAFIQIIIKKKKAGFIESGIQLGAYLETDSFL